MLLPPFLSFTLLIYTFFHLFIIFQPSLLFLSSFFLLFFHPSLCSLIYHSLTQFSHSLPPPPHFYQYSLPLAERTSKHMEELLASAVGLKVPVDNKAGDSDILRVIEAYCAGGQGAIRKCIRLNRDDSTCCVQWELSTLVLSVCDVVCGREIVGVIGRGRVSKLYEPVLL